MLVPPQPVQRRTIAIREPTSGCRTQVEWSGSAGVPPRNALLAPTNTPGTGLVGSDHVVRSGPTTRPGARPAGRRIDCGFQPASRTCLAQASGTATERPPE